MKGFLIYLAVLALHLSAGAQEAFHGEFKLKSKAHLEGMMLAPEYTITIDDGKAVIKYTTEGKEKTDEGAVTLTIRNGIDPATKRALQIVGYIRIEVTKGGWASDKFVTRIDLPFTAEPAQKPKLVFSCNTNVEILWLDKLPNGLMRYSDPMNIRMNVPYELTTVTNPSK